MSTDSDDKKNNVQQPYVTDCPSRNLWRYRWWIVLLLLLVALYYVTDEHTVGTAKDLYISTSGPSSGLVSLDQRTSGALVATDRETTRLLDELYGLH